MMLMIEAAASSDSSSQEMKTAPVLLSPRMSRRSGLPTRLLIAAPISAAASWPIGEASLPQRPKLFKVTSVFS